MQNSPNLKQLLAIASGPLGSLPASQHQSAINAWRELVSIRNGFFAFESALLVRPVTSGETGLIGAREWNETQLWKDAYGSIQPQGFFFAEDIFGNQFGFDDENVIWFDAETGEVRFFSESLEHWAKIILEDYDLHTGYRVAHHWQAQFGPLKPGHRLVLKQPLILGGRIELSNVLVWRDLSAMRARGALAVQLLDVPDGGSISFELLE